VVELVQFVRVEGGWEVGVQGMCMVGVGGGVVEGGCVGGATTGRDGAVGFGTGAFGGISGI